VSQEEESVFRQVRHVIAGRYQGVKVQIKALTALSLRPLFNRKPSQKKGLLPSPRSADSLRRGLRDALFERSVVGAQLICKWGGTLTQAGRSQARAVGKRYRELLSEEDEELLRHVKVYLNSERRVQHTAEELLRELLGPDHGVGVVCSDKSQGWLGTVDEAAGEFISIKEKIQEALGEGGGVGDTEGAARAALVELRGGGAALMHMRVLVEELVAAMRRKLRDVGEGYQLYGGGVW
jgi:hypothetical protein